jgi:uncharacterized protein (TIGR00661 family)
MPADGGPALVGAGRLSFAGGAAGRAAQANMAKIFLSMSGEGRGHATRVRALVEALAADHTVRVFAPGDAHAFLAPLYAETGVEVERLPGLCFAYNGRQRLSYPATFGRLVRYLRELPATLDRLTAAFERERPDLAITDFEPALPRAARRCGVPYLSVDHQHFLRTYDLSSLPARLRWRAAYMGWIVGTFYSGQVETVVSSFYFAPLRRGCRRVTQVGVLLRPEVRAARAEVGGHLVAYWRKFVDECVLQALEQTGLEVRVYGLGARPPRGRMTFHPVSEKQFLADLAGCRALVCTAGNQLVGEALYLGKPVLALAETNNFEQEINGHFLQASGAGVAMPMSRFTAGDLHGFLAGLDQFRRRIRPERLDGLPEVLTVLRRHLPERRHAPRRVPVPQLVAA